MTREAVAVEQVLNLAAQQVGIAESPPNSNRQKYGAAYGMNGVAWCAIFEWWIFHELHADNALPEKTAGVYALMAAFKRVGRFYDTPESGDIVIYNYGQGHTGIVESVQPKTITAIEGNTSASSAGSQSNGGIVARKVRPRDSHILGYGRPRYGSAPAPAPAAKKVEEDMSDARTIRWPDGSTSEVTEDGALLNAGAPSFGSFHSLSSAERQNLSDPPAPFALTPARTVPVVYKDPSGNNVIVDLPDKNGGVIAWVIGKSGSVDAYKFDATFAKNHKV